MIRPLDMVARLQTAAWLKREETQSILAVLGGEDKATRAVGGIVRDTILGRDPASTDIDLATTLRPHEVTLRAERAGISVHPTGIEHGTVTLRLDQVVAEVTTLREDVETDGRRAVVQFGIDWRRDAERRDFTMNALYADMNGELFDPLAGLEDCLAGRVRFIGEPAQRIEEDRLRVYRFFRFSASHGGERLDAAGLAACQAATGLEVLSAERVGSELRRMLSLPRAAITLKAMAEAGIVGLSSHTLQALHSYERRARRPDLSARLAIIISESGATRLKGLWRLSNDEVSAAEAILTVAGLLAGFKLNEAAYRHPAALADGVEVAAVLADWSDAGKSAVLDQLQAVSVPRFPLGGGDLLLAGMRPGRALGAELDRLEQLWIASGFTLGRDALLAEIQAS